MFAWLWLIPAYFLGSIPFGLIVATGFCGLDPRKDGSGNTGATNVARLCGVKWGVLVLVLDALKGLVAVAVSTWIVPESALMHSLTAMAVILGHRYSAFMKFRGGKAVATTVGVFIPLAFFQLLAAAAVCVVVIWRSGFVSLGSLTLVTLLPVFLAFSGNFGPLPLAVLVAAIVYYAHRDNIRRLIKGEEKPWITGKKTKDSPMTASRPADRFPAYRGSMQYTCLSCDARHGIDELLYTCPSCGEVLLLEDTTFDSLKKTPGQEWREIFDNRASTRNPALRGIFRFYEIMAPVMEEKDILYLGDGNTPIVAASPAFARKIGVPFAYKNDGQNPSASFKDRGMACAFSYLQSLVRKHNWDSVLTICASTGDTSAAAALYASYLGGPIQSVVLLPQGKVTPQQLSQPLGSGATVLEIPGVFDDCMKVVEQLADTYRVALLNSKNSWRILGQESFSFEVAQWYGWDVANLAIFVPIGNAGNVTAIMSGFLKLHALGITGALPRIFGVQSEHADPVYRYYAVPDASKRHYSPVPVTPSVAQAAMIGNPVSFPRVKFLADKYIAIGGENAFQVMQVTEQSIMDSMIEANRHGHIACTQGGESLAGLKAAISHNLIRENETAVLDSTAHALKFLDFQHMYFTNTFPPEYEVTPDPALANAPRLVISQDKKAALPEQEFVREAAAAVAETLGLAKK